MGRHFKDKKSPLSFLFELIFFIAVLSALSFVVVYTYRPELIPEEIRQKAVKVSKEAHLAALSVKEFFYKEKEVRITGTFTADPEIKMPLSSDAVPTSPDVGPPPDERPVLAIVVDDGGNDLSIATKVSLLKLPLTWAILPYTRYALQTSEIAEKEDIPYLLHLPMQAEIDKDPKEYLIGEGMDRAEIRRITESALDSLPSPIGINNHRGSLATSKWDIMVPIIDVLKDRELIFLDSRTSGGSVAYDVAKAAGIGAFRNRGFLDGTPDKNSIKARFDEAVRQALKRGDMTVICHFRPATLLFLEDLDKNYEHLPVKLVTIPELGEFLSKKEIKEVAE